MQIAMQPAVVSLRTKFARGRGWLISVGVHLLVVLGALGVLERSPRVAPYRLPGTAKGVKFLTYYNPGSAEHATDDASIKRPAVHASASALHASLAVPKPVESQSLKADPGVGSSVESGLGSGEISIALQQYFPHPAPDLSTLPRGTSGEVVLNAVIDEHGRISDLTVLKGMGPTIDDAVVATVKQWSWKPATKNGVPIQSEQELHFRYERS
jgi:periplasmic protein TonB